MVDFETGIGASAVLALCLLAGSGCSEEAGSPQTEAQSILTGEFSLSKEKQKYLWEIEHLAFLVIQDVLPVFRDAIQEDRPQPLLKYLAPDFVGRLFEKQGSQIRHGPVTLEVWDQGRDSIMALNREAFVQELVSYGQAFSKVEKVAIHVPELSPVEDGELEGRWKSLWQFRVTGALKDGGRGEHVLTCRLRFARLTEACGSDVGWIDGIEATRAWSTASAGALMEEITDTTGINVKALADNWKRGRRPFHPSTGGARLLDMDRDGRVDLLIRELDVLYLYHGLGRGKFEDVTRAAGLSAVRFKGYGGVLVADLDNDGFEDLVITADDHGMLVTDLYQNQGNGTFHRLRRSEHDLRLYPIRQFAVGDYDGDGKVDLYLAKAGPPAPPDQQSFRWVGDRSSNEGVLLRNLGGWRFEDVTAAAGLAGENLDVFASVWLDLEPDGDPDLFLANHMGLNVLWENRGDGTFIKRPMPPGFGGFSMGAATGDLDGDGDSDLYVANMYSAAGNRVMKNLRPEDYPEGAFELIRGFTTGNELYENKGNRPMAPLGVSAGVHNSGWSYGPALVDLDGDGALDIYSPAGFQSFERGKPDG